MPCYRPLAAWQSPSTGDMVFKFTAAMTAWERFELPCGQCIGCRLEKSRQWAMRCMHEASLHEHNSFVTLTYRDDKLPFTFCSTGPLDPTLNKKDLQLFWKKLRNRHHDPISYFACGEYGDDTQRPHYHAIIFGYDFADKKPHKRSKNGEMLYKSELLERLWPNGHALIGNVSFESAAYVARYCLKKRTGLGANSHYQGREPEFATMSLKPAIGKRWLQKWKKDVYPHDYVIMNGKKLKPPKFYDNLLTEDELISIKEMRKETALLHEDNNTEARLAVREELQKRKQNELRRNLQ